MWAVFNVSGVSVPFFTVPTLLFAWMQLPFLSGLLLPFGDYH
jgi:hypothetical protein